MLTLEYFVHKFNLDLNQPSPISIPSADRETMAKVLGELGFKVGAEIGVAEGRHCELLYQNIPGLFLYCIDIWSDTKKYHEATHRLSNYEWLAYKGTSMDALHDIEDSSLDFCYIDAAHDFLNVAQDICGWIKKVRPGGILFGHDFTTIHSGRDVCHVEDVVTAYARSHAISPWFVLGEEKYIKRFLVVKEWMFIC